MLYGGNNNWFAAYAYWYFKLYGHAGRRLLDGGRKKWELDCRELTDELAERAATSYTAKEPDTLDPRVPRRGRRRDRRRRTSSTSARPTSTPAGCSPRRTSRRSRRSAAATSRRRRNMPWSKAANDDGTFKSDDELRRCTPRPGVDSAKDTIAYCRIGERSAHTWFVLHEMLGKPNVKNYDGSWTEYGSLVGVPVQLGDEPGLPEGGGRLMCGATAGGPRSRGSTSPRSRDPGRRAAGRPAGRGAYVRLLDRTGEFTAEVPTSATGQFRFFAAPGRGRCAPWHPAPRSTARSSPSRAAVAEVEVALPA